MRTLGQVAYEAYCDAVGWRSIRGDQLPSWDNMPWQKIKAAWEAAGLAAAVPAERDENQLKKS
jgi:hypothetical protein